jgi:DNA-binding response OmpR family regulator
VKARVLIIEDEEALADLIAAYLAKEGVDVAIAHTAEDGQSLFRERGADLIVLDVNLPGMDGFEFLAEFRAESKVPVIIVSARESDEDIIMGLSSGADEFVTKPFKPRVLVARIRALLRRSRMAGDSLPSTTSIRFGDFTLEPENYHLARDGERVSLSTREFEVLRFLALNPGKAFTPADIYQEVWGNEFGDVSAIAVYVRRIRSKIEADPKNPAYLQTIYGHGYRFNSGTDS